MPRCEGGEQPESHQGRLPTWISFPPSIFWVPFVREKGPIRKEPLEMTPFGQANAARIEARRNILVSELVDADGNQVQLAKIPGLLKPLFKPNRYKIAYGGRGSAKSWSFARALLLLASESQLRIVCFREVQKSIEESVHALLKLQIAELGLEGWIVEKEKIYNPEIGSEFKFAGLSAETASSMKSYEGFDIAWVEEAESVTQTSWNLLIPTIRKEGSEIWITFNPQLDTDYTYVEFVENAPDGAFVVLMNWRDNPWFPETLQLERLRAKKRMSADEYNNIWEGRTRAAVAGAIYAEQIAEMRAEGRYIMVPHNPRHHVHVILDLGWNDAMFVIMAQRVLSALCIIEAFQVDHTTLEELNILIRGGDPNDPAVGVIRQRRARYKWGFMFLPHDGAHGDFKTGRSTMDIMKKDHGWRTKPVPNVDIETGIKRARGLLPMTYIDKDLAQPLMQAMRRYRRQINKHEEAATIVHDAASHGADDYRYTALVYDRMTNPDAERASSNNRVVSYGIDDEMGM
jgi:phage terminase large subunit